MLAALLLKPHATGRSRLVMHQLRQLINRERLPAGRRMFHVEHQLQELWEEVRDAPEPPPLAEASSKLHELRNLIESYHRLRARRARHEEEALAMVLLLWLEN